tara:strand:+ start:371 stop:595 length:225 start_codon:yes stop_codon:yes gene_type:complete
MILNEWLTKIKQWWAGMLERGEESPLVEQPPVKQSETTVDPVLENIKKKSRSSALPTKKPKIPKKKKETANKKK